MGSLAPYTVPVQIASSFAFANPTNVIQTLFTITPTSMVELSEFEADLEQLQQPARITLERRIDGVNWAIVSVMDYNPPATVPPQIDMGLFINNIIVDEVSHFRIRIQSYVDEGAGRTIAYHYWQRTVS